MEIKEETIIRRYIEFDGIRFYPDQKGYWIGQRKDSKKPVRLHVYVWEHYNGPVPDGYHIHHKDLNPDNNEISNLEAIEKGEHLRYHAQFQNVEWARANLAKNARPAASEWHRSEEGRQMHREMYEIHTRPLWDKKVSLKCEVCGKEFEAPELMRKKARFCSNNCKAQYRRDVGIDNVERPCEICNTTFWTNKYAPKRFCSEQCRSIHRKKNPRKATHTVMCKICGKPFETAWAKSVYCSDECRGEANRQRAAANREQKKAHLQQQVNP